MKLRERINLAIGKAYINSVSAVEQLVHGASLNPLSEKLWANPYHYHNQMREKSPIHYSPAVQAYWVTEFDLVQEILRDKRFGADVRKYPNRVARITKNMDEQRLDSFNNPSMLDLDPPDHSRVRRLVSQGFMHKFIQSLEPNIQKIVDDCLAKYDNANSFDLVEALAAPLPAIVIAEMLGLPETDHDKFQAWSHALIDGTSTNDHDKIAASLAASKALRNYFKEIIQVKKQDLSDDMLSQLILAEEEGDKLNEIELYNTCLLLLAAGHETTTRLIGNGMYLLLQSPDQLEILRNNPDLIPQAIEEMLRFEPPVQATRRFATEDIHFHGTDFKRGDLIFVSIAASNRDPKANPNPEQFNVTRESPQQISFGYGIHLCIGASLARMESKIAFETLLDRFSEIELVDDKPAWGNNAFFRGLDHLNIRVKPAVQT